MTEYTCPHGNPVRPGRPFTLDQCRACWLRGPRSEPAARMPPGPHLPCRHRGDMVPLGRRYELGLGSVRDWYPCGHPKRPLGDHVCLCRGCGPLCPGYELLPGEPDE